MSRSRISKLALVIAFLLGAGAGSYFFFKASRSDRMTAVPAPAREEMAAAPKTSPLPGPGESSPATPLAPVPMLVSETSAILVAPSAVISEAKPVEPSLPEAEPVVKEKLPVAPPEPARDEKALATLRGLDAWALHTRGTRGFLAALPLLARAEDIRLVTAGAPAAPAVTDARPAGLPDRLFAVETRLADLHDRARVPVQSYAWAKAQAWLEFALDESALRDRSGIVNDAAAQAEKIIAELEAPASTARDQKLAAAAGENPPLGAVARTMNFRPDLQATARHARPADLSSHLLSADPALADLARLEVALVQAAYEHSGRGIRASLPYQRTAEKIAARLSSAKP